MSEVIPRQWASARDNGDFVCIETYSGYRSSAPDPQGAQHLLAPDAGDEMLGAALLDALSHSRFLELSEIPIFFDYKQSEVRYQEWIKNLMDRYGYKTKRALFKKMKDCAIESLAGKITIRPSNHEKLEQWTGDGISEEDHVVIPDNSSPAEVGAALRLALSRCI